MNLHIIFIFIRMENLLLKIYIYRWSVSFREILRREKVTIRLNFTNKLKVKNIKVNLNKCSDFFIAGIKNLEYSEIPIILSL